MNIRALILTKLNKDGEVRAADVIKETGFSRAYINRFFQQLRNEGRLILIGKANKTHYIPADKKKVERSKKSTLKINRVLSNDKLAEDIILSDVMEKTGILLDIPDNVSAIVKYAFLEMLNNAIEHSESKKIRITMQKIDDVVFFNVIDEGIGIFNNVMRKKGLNSEIEAIQDILKGKQTTAPESHSGEGIFFTSKAGDVLTIQSSRKKLIFNNIVSDIFIHDIKYTKGTKIAFSIKVNSARNINKIFKQYTDDSYEFYKTKVTIHLYKMGVEYISRSQARRLVGGLNKFKSVILDFKDVESVGQGFADEIFRIWKKQYPKITIEPINTNENILFMINRALGKTC